MTIELTTASKRIDAFEQVLGKHGLSRTHASTLALYFACRANVDGVTEVKREHLLRWAAEASQIIERKIEPYLEALAEGLAMIGVSLPVEAPTVAPAEDQGQIAQAG